MKFNTPVKHLDRTVIKYHYLDEDYEKYYKSYLHGIVLSAHEPNTSIEITSVYKGKVILVTDEDKYLGLVVIVKLEDKYVRYINLDESYVAVGDKVEVGTILGTFGIGINNSMNKDLHFSIASLELDNLLDWSNVHCCNNHKHFLDPIAYLEQYGVVLQ